MKQTGSLEDAIFDSGEIMKRTAKAVVNNMGKLIALLAALLMLAVTFTDISFTGIFTEDFASSLLLLITSAYIIYFSLEDTGERAGALTEEYIRARERYDELRIKISGERVEALRLFCIGYSKRELDFRKSNALLSRGLSADMLKEYEAGKSFGRRTDRALGRIKRIKPVAITPKDLLCRERGERRSELENPEKRKLPMLLLKLLPSTVCMVVTVSVMLTAKEGLTPADILNGILKLSALPLIGFKGYSAGYSYAKHSLSLWAETKANILEHFLEESPDDAKNCEKH